MISRSRQGALGTPTETESAKNFTFWEAQNIRPFGQCVFFSSVLNHVIGSYVVLLFLASRPDAIVRTISLRVIFAFKCVTRRGSSAHIRNEPFKRSPFWADRYSASSVILIRSVLGIFTSLYHGAPDSVLRLSRFLFGHAMLDVRAATRSTAVVKIVDSHSSHCPAGATAIDVVESVFFSPRTTYDNPAAKVCSYRRNFHNLFSRVTTFYTMALRGVVVPVLL